MAATAAQVQQALFTGCGMCGGSFCEHGVCRVCGSCSHCDEKPAPRQERHAQRSEAERLHDKAEQRRRDVEQAMKELASNYCVCGSRKREQQSFCKRCYTSLPKDIRSGLWLHILSGYLEYWRKAKESLRASGRISDQEGGR